MSLARFLMALRARWRLALSVLLAVLGLTLAVSLLLPTRYTATAMVLVDARAADPVAAGGAQPPQASTYMAMQVDLIQSERVARAVIAATGLGRADGPAPRAANASTLVAPLWPGALAELAPGRWL